MYVIRLRHDAVLVNAGSYDISPKSSLPTLICRKSAARITSPSSIGSSYFFPVRLSVMVSVLFAIDVCLDYFSDVRVQHIYSMLYTASSISCLSERKLFNHLPCQRLQPVILLIQ